MESVFTCPVCERACDAEIGSRHHVLPKSQGGRSVTVICRDCHRQIHRLFSVKDLARRYPTLGALKATTPMQTWINWVRKRPARRVSSAAPVTGGRGACCPDRAGTQARPYSDSPLPSEGEGRGVRELPRVRA